MTGLNFWRKVCGAGLLLCAFFMPVRQAAATPVPDGMVQAPASVEQWGSIEITLAGSSQGNPFTEVELSARFRQGEKVLDVAGFYDGEGIYKIRFMPESTGIWQYTTSSNQAALRGQSGSFTVTAPAAGNHGPVKVRNTFHFAYADGQAYHQLGTTSYAWIHQGDALEEQTLRTLATSPFNKLRMTVFPKHYEWSKNEPQLYPFEGTPPAQWDLTRFNPAFFRHLEQRISQLRTLGIEADIILFHPYDKGHWGFDRMAAAADDRYLRYVVARLSAFRNVWWSMANEFDFMTAKTPADWDRYFQIVQANDPYQHLRSIHNGSILYNHTLPWVTHVSIQSGSATEDFERAVIYRDVYRKPVIFDEVKYEGNLPQRWGRLSAEEMVLRFWHGSIAGTYVGHSESYLDPEDIIWWAKGGVFHGQSVPRLTFLRKILEDGPADGLEPIDKWQDYPFAGKRGQYYLGYFGNDPRTNWRFELAKAGLAEGMKFRVDVIDTWNMSITPVPGLFELKKQDNYLFADKDGRSVSLPGRPYMAVRIVKLP
ncbi:DUF5060 domain-containing protein [Undibacterium sp. Ji50W]|uniref:DUF5060 domain-containing protein n=1 Tax=Undibacterium sp. Ji50W TaxID=3413041 RepID=UPI003BF12F10